MNQKVAFFLQPFGLGDLCFCQSIAHHFLKKGYEVVWPVFPHFLEAVRRAYPRISWRPYTLNGMLNLEFNMDSPHVEKIPICWAHMVPPATSKYSMRAKYDLLGLDYRTWKEHAGFVRDISYELRLCEELGVDLSKPFNLVNRTFRSSFEGQVEVSIDNDYPVVEITFRPQYSLFDYSTLIEHATEIHAANSSIFYLFELLDYKGQVHLYPRKPEQEGFPQIDYLKTKPYILH